MEALALFSEGLDVTKWPQGRAVPSVALSCVPFPRSRCRKENVKWPKAKRFLEERKEELEEVAHELAETEHENTVLRHNIERIKEEKDFTM